MPAIESTEQTIALIQEKTGKTIEEIQEAIAKKKEKYSGWVSNAGAAMLVAKELGIELELEKKINEKASISSLKAGMNNIDIEARVLQAFQAKEYEKNSRKGKILNLIVGDETGEIRLSLWHNDAKRFEEEKIEKGAKLLLKNCKVQEFNSNKQLSLDYNGSFEVLKEGSEKTTRLEELKEGMQNIDVMARIARVYPGKKFIKEAKEGKLANFEITDGTATARATAWNNMAEETGKLEKNQLVKIENAYTRQGMKGIELHLGWQARIITNPKTSLSIPEIAFEKIERKSFSELKENESFEQKAVLLDFQPGKLFFEVCPNCGKKPERIEGKLLCNNCGQIQKTEKRLVASALLDDGTTVMRASFFGKQAEELMQATTQELVEKQEKGELEKELEIINERLVGREIILQGIARTNKLSGELEINARAVKKADAEKEAESLIKEIN